MNSFYIIPNIKPSNKRSLSLFLSCLIPYVYRNAFRFLLPRRNLENRRVSSFKIVNATDLFFGEGPKIPKILSRATFDDEFEANDRGCGSTPHVVASYRGSQYI